MGGQVLTNLSLFKLSFLGSGGWGGDQRCTMSLIFPFFFFEGVPKNETQDKTQDDTQDDPQYDTHDDRMTLRMTLKMTHTRMTKDQKRLIVNT